MKTLISFWNRNFLTYEFLLSVVFTLTLVVWYQFFNGHEYINALLANHRSSIYSTLAPITGSLLGFILASMSIVIAFLDSKHFQIIKKSANHITFWKTFSKATWAFGFATLISLAGLVFDQDSSPVYAITFTTVFATTLATMRIMRIIWILDKMINIFAFTASDE